MAKPQLQAIPIPLLDDNYVWAIFAETPGPCVLIDASDGAPLVAALEHHGLEPSHVLLTHHHWDHTQGLPALLERWPRLQVLGHSIDSDRIAPMHTPVTDQSVHNLLGSAVKVIAVPGHTRGAVAFYWSEQNWLFTGDTLFLAGCGRMFEGSPAIMWPSLCQLANLPPATQIYCGHEYTVKNLAFAATIEPKNQAIAQRLAWAKQQRAKGEPTVPGSLADEQQTNVFLRAHLNTQHAPEALWSPSEASDLGAVARFGELRKLRDRY